MLIEPLNRELLVAQGRCCGNGCSLCPYTPKHTAGATELCPEGGEQIINEAEWNEFVKVIGYRNGGLRVGFTGASVDVPDILRDVLSTFVGMAEFHHGDCVGMDAVADGLVRDMFPAAVVHIHPCDISGMRAGCDRPGDVVYPVDRPMVRNSDIVSACDVLVACPRSRREVLRSGSWATIRRARGRGIPVIFAIPQDDREKPNQTER